LRGLIFRVHENREHTHFRSGHPKNGVSEEYAAKSLTHGRAANDPVRNNAIVRCE
jgi:hypothetical protein